MVVHFGLGFWGRLARSSGLPDRPSDWGQHWGQARACVWASRVADAGPGGRASRLLDLNTLPISSKINENLRKSMKINGNHQKSMEIHVFY